MDKTVRGTEGTGENEWFTPPEYIKLARAVLGAIDLDPATSDEAQRIVQAAQYFTKADDGLKHEWRGHVWLNPPYAQPFIAEFASKMVAELRAGRVDAAIMLTHNYTDTAWFHELAGDASAICFTRGCVKFYSGDDIAAPTQGQAFTYFGDEVEKFKRVLCTDRVCCSRDERCIMRMFSEELKRGRAAEFVVGMALRECGFFTIDLGGIATGGAPRMFGPHGYAVVLPDLLTIDPSSGKHYPFEVKLKHKPTLTRRTRILEHGISRRLFEQYKNYQETTRTTLILGVLEEESGELLAKSLNLLGAPRYYDGERMDQGGMVFWPRHRFRTFSQVTSPQNMPLFANIRLPPTLPPMTSFDEVAE